MGQCLASKKRTETARDPKKITEKEIQMLLDNTNYRRDEIEEWHAGFIV